MSVELQMVTLSWQVLARLLRYNRLVTFCKTLVFFHLRRKKHPRYVKSFCLHFELLSVFRVADVS